MTSCHRYYSLEIRFPSLIASTVFKSAGDCQMVVTDKGFLLVPVDRPHWIFRGRIVSKKNAASTRGFTVDCLIL